MTLKTLKLLETLLLERPLNLGAEDGEIEVALAAKREVRELIEKAEAVEVDT